MPPTQAQIDQFQTDGFLHLPGVVGPANVASCLEVIWAEIGYDRNDPQTWVKPVIHLTPSDSRPFKTAFESPRLFAALDQIVGPGRWRPRPNLGNFVIRFPHNEDTGDTGWHIDSSFPPDVGDTTSFSEWRVNAVSRGRALLMLFLLSDVGPTDGPTRIRVGSHHDVAEVLQPFGSDGISGAEAGPLVTEASKNRPEAMATGLAGDVYLCHPFLAHAAQRVRGNKPRIMAQPGLDGEPFRLDQADDSLSPVEIAASQQRQSPT